MNKQVGVAVGLAAIATISTSVDTRNGPTEDGKTAYAGVAGGFWFVFAATVAELIAVLVFYRIKPVKQQGAEDIESGDRGEAGRSDGKTGSEGADVEKTQDSGDSTKNPGADAKIPS